MTNLIRNPCGHWRQGLFASVAIAAVATTAVPAQAQSMDYGALEQLFGEPVTTSATGTPQRARDVPAEMEIITADDIRRSGAIDIPGVLSHVVGIDVQRVGPLGRLAWAVAIEVDQRRRAGRHGDRAKDDLGIELVDGGELAEARVEIGKARLEPPHRDCLIN